MKKTINKKSVLLSIGTRVSAVASSFGVTLIGANLLGQENFGYITFWISLITIAVVIIHAGSPILIIKYASIKDEEDGGKELKRLNKIILFVDCTYVVLALIVLLALYFYDKDFEISKEEIFYVLSTIFFVYKVKQHAGLLNGLGYIISSAFFDQLIKNGILITLILIAYNILGENFVHHNQNIFFLYWMAYFLTYCVAFIYTRSIFQLGYIPLGKPYETFREDVVPSIVIGAGLLMTSINGNFDVLLVAAMLDSNSVALYKIALAVSSLMVIAAVALNVILMPRVAKYFKKIELSSVEKEARQMTKIAVYISTVIFIVIVVCGERLLIVIFGSQYIDAYFAMLILAVGQLLNALFGPVAACLNMMGEEKKVFYGVALAAITNILLSMPLTIMMEIEGAALANALSVVVWNIYLTQYFKRKYQINITIFGK